MPHCDDLLDLRVRRRRLVGFSAVGLLLCVDVFATGIFGGGERTLAVIRTVVLPGLPFLEWHLSLGIAAVAAALAAIGAWLRWGVDWLVFLVMTICLLLAGFVMPLHHEPPEVRYVVSASHEFTVVLVVFALVARLRLVIARLPGTGWVKSRLPKGLLFPAVDTARAAAIASINSANRDGAREWLDDARLLRRAASVNRWARFRTRGDTLDGAHAPLRAALSLSGAMTPASQRAFLDEARSRIAGVPDSEPTWIRPLDGTLAALALQDLGADDCVARWRWIFRTRFALRHGRRPAALHTPSMLSIGAARSWEHAAATAVAHQAGWIDAEDWSYLRPRCLGAAAGNADDSETMRLIAAGRVWAALRGDSEAIEIFSRRTLTDDALARVLDELASAIRSDASFAWRPG
jgi:hypothetical protein